MNEKFNFRGFIKPKQDFYMLAVLDKNKVSDLVSKNSKNLINDFQKRRAKLEFEINDKFPTSEFEISKLENDFGPAVIEGDVEALVVSDETKSKGDLLNQLRKESDLSPVQIIIVPMILAKDGNRISSSRIRNSEIDTEGNIR